MSREFFEHFGDKLANELVELINQVHVAFKMELREQMELGFGRLEAKLEDRFEKGFARIEERFDQQNRLFILAWVTLFAAVVGMGLR